MEPGRVTKLQREGDEPADKKCDQDDLGILQKVARAILERITRHAHDDAVHKLRKKPYPEPGILHFAARLDPFLSFLKENRLSIRADPRALVLQHFACRKSLTAFNATRCCRTVPGGLHARFTQRRPVFPSAPPDLRIRADAPGANELIEFRFTHRSPAVVIFGVIALHMNLQASVTSSEKRAR